MLKRGDKYSGYISSASSGLIRGWGNLDHHHHHHHLSYNAGHFAVHYVPGSTPVPQNHMNAMVMVMVKVKVKSTAW